MLENQRRDAQKRIQNLLKDPNYIFVKSSVLDV